MIEPRHKGVGDFVFFLIDQVVLEVGVFNALNDRLLPFRNDDLAATADAVANFANDVFLAAGKVGASVGYAGLTALFVTLPIERRFNKV